MANNLINPNIIAREALFLVVNMMVMGGLVNRRYSNEFNEVGDTIRVRKPVKFLTVDGPTITGQIQSVKETSTDVTIDQNPVVPFQFEDKDMALTIGDFRERYIIPAANALANRVDRSLTNLAINVPNLVGTPGTTPDDFDAVAAAGEMLDRCSTPRDGLRSFVIDPRANRMLASSFQAGFNPQDMQGQTFKNGLVKSAAGFDIYMDQNVIAYQDFPLTGAVTVNGAGQTGSIINVIFAVPGEGYKKGAILTFTTVNKINDVSKEDTGFQQQFVVTADILSGGGGLAAVPVYPPVVPPAVDTPESTVTNSPVAASVVTLVTAPVPATPVFSRQNIAFHRDAFGFVSANLRVPQGMDMAEVVSYKGVTMRFVRGFDINTGRFISRLELLYGITTFYKDMATRVAG